jgi:hypothetical protein
MDAPTTEVRRLTDPSLVPKSGVTAWTSQEELRQTRSLLIDSGLLTKGSSKVSSGREMLRNRSFSAWQKFTKTLTTSWLLEFVLWSMSCRCFITIVLLLWYHDKQPLPQWPLRTTLNALVSVFSTIAKGTLIPLVAQALG